MPCTPCGNGKYRLGSSECMYTSKAACERAYAAYRAKKHSTPAGHHSAANGSFLDKRAKKFGIEQ